MSAAVLDMAAKNPTPGKKRDKVLKALVIIGLVMAAAIIIPKVAYGQVTPHAQEFAKTLQAGETLSAEHASLAKEAANLDEIIEKECHAPQRKVGEELTAPGGDGELFDSINAGCRELAVANSGYVDRVQATADLFIGLAEGFGDIVGTVGGYVTDTTIALLNQGEVEQVTRDLYADVENGEVQ